MPVDWNLANKPADYLTPIVQGQDYVNQLYNHAALLDAGQKYAAGDYQGAAKSVGSRGDFKTAESLRGTGNALDAGQQYAAGDIPGAQATLAKGGDIQGAEGLAQKQADTFIKQQAVLKQTVPFLTAAVQAHPEQAAQAFDMIAPNLQMAGTPPERIKQLRDSFIQNPAQTIQLFDGLSKKSIHQTPDGSLVAVDDEGNNAQVIYKSGPKAPEGYQADPSHPGGLSFIPGGPADPSRVKPAEGYQVDPNNPSALKFVPGGPADPAVIEKNALNRREVIINNQPPQQPGTELTPDDLDLLGTQYLATGRMPALGYGKDAARMRTQVIGAAVQLQKKYGVTSAAVVGQQAATKANTQALGQVTKTLNQIASFEQTAQKNADLALSLAPKGIAGGIPLFNGWIQAGRKASGNPDVAAFDLALTTFKNEYARVVNSATGGGVTTDAARSEIDGKINGAQTLQQLQRVIQVAKQDMANRASSLQDRAGFLQQSISATAGGEQQPQQPGFAPPSPQPAPSGSVPPPPPGFVVH